MSKAYNPYRDYPDYAFWRKAVGGVGYQDVDPVVSAPFVLSPTDRVVTAGSCFAQHIARYLKQSGFNYVVTECAHPLLSPEVAGKYNYGTFTARYGNLYTTRQLLQLYKRVYGVFTPTDDVWVDGDTLVDPYRPQIQPNGFSSRREYDLDRQQHYAAVRQAFETLDVFVFTLGLTECWMSREDGAVYPLCPGVSGGEFDAERHEFRNFTVDEVVADMLEFIGLLRQINPRSRVILTVSPVPLMATAEPRHVLVSTTYSKSVLRVACEQIVSRSEGVAYFPSYEIITGNFNRGSYYAEDLRTVTEEGVSHVMRLFMKHYTEGNGVQAEVAARERAEIQRSAAHLEEMERLDRLVCEEEALGRVRD